MALRHWDGFTAYSELADLDHLYVREGFSTNIAVLPNGGPSEIGAVRLGGANLLHSSFYRTITSSSTVIIGFWFKWSGSDTSGGDLYDEFLTLRASTTEIISMRVYSDGTLRIYEGGVVRFDSGDVAYSIDGLTTNYLIPELEYRIEMRALISATVGELELRVNTLPWGKLTGIDTGASNITRVYFHTGWDGSGAEFEVSEIYVLDDTGTFNNDFFGIWKAQLLRPTSDDVAAFGSSLMMPFRTHDFQQVAQRRKNVNYPALDSPRNLLL